MRRLGTGGMGDVFLADDLKLNRPVAIKFLLGAGDDRARKRLLTEARAVAALDHPNICAVHEIDSDEFIGDFIVMQYVEGEPLNIRLKRGRMAPDEALGVCARIADGLRVAHERGIIHRDLKPHNVILTPGGVPKLLDFGLAKHVASAPEAAEAATASQLTHPLAVVGTPGYMSPEHVRHKAVDHRSDLFALGCLLYECLTGRRAFAGDTAADVNANVLHHSPPPPSSLVPELTADHDAIAARLLEKEPARRFQKAAEAVAAMRALAPSRWTDSTELSAAFAAIRVRDKRRMIAIVSIAAVVITAVAIWQGPWFRRLPEAPPEAAGWYAKGIEAIREGRFATARSSLDQAVNLFPQYALAHLRLAEARSELDDALGANRALVKAADVIPTGARLRREEDLRLRAVRTSVLRQHENAIGAFRNLTDLHPRDAAAWLDLGRSQEAAGRRADAVASYQKALAIDSQYAAAHFRLGVLLVQMTSLDAGAKEFDEAIRLYHAAGQSEGEVEALIRKAEMLTTSGRHVDARAAVERAIPMIDTQDSFHRVRARFALARLTAVDGNYSQAEALSRTTVDEATAAGLHATASQGLTDFGYTLTVREQYAEAAQVLARATELAIKHEAKRAEMRSKLQLASLLLAKGDRQQAIDASVEPLKFYADNRFLRVEADGKNIISRAYEGLEKYADAARLSAEVLTLSESMKDEALAASTLESIAGQLTNQGRLPEALEHRERLEAMNRAQKNNLALPFDLNNRAELLIRLGRGADAETPLDELTRKAQEGVESFKARLRRTAMLRAMRASTERRWVDVEPFARIAMTMADPKAKPDINVRWGSLLLEHARAHQGRSRMPVSSITLWIEETTNPAVRREVVYWVVQTLLARGDTEKAHQIAVATLAEPGAAANTELRWRLAALASLAGRNLTQRPGEDASIRADAIRELQALKAAWPSHADAYLARPDLAALRQRLQ